eukprot:CAMPEP_0185764892 /NCGR_PEP_ID=MMETSP1174-20130828/24478_1 /TAXON_ID=35687 /ORGANISM="Dictyocha speculum, Strain CCMP1381" /LENGTH=47 /DNA_ID= /DNA_START= /DNA_END= /DNA_ORIENTATION=
MTKLLALRPKESSVHHVAPLAAHPEYTVHTGDAMYLWHVGCEDLLGP